MFDPITVAVGAAVLCSGAGVSAVKAARAHADLVRLKQPISSVLHAAFGEGGDGDTPPDMAALLDQLE